MTHWHAYTEEVEGGRGLVFLQHGTDESTRTIWTEIDQSRMESEQGQAWLNFGLKEAQEEATTRNTRVIRAIGKLFEGIGEFYKEIGQSIGGLVFITSWVYCTFTYGFLLGFGLGWLPSMLLALFAIALWPVFIVLLIVFWTPLFLMAVGFATVVGNFVSNLLH